MVSAGSGATGRSASRFSRQASCEKWLRGNSEERTTVSTASWVGIQSQERACCWATIRSYRNSYLPTYLDTWVGFGITLLGGFVIVRMASLS